MAKKYYWESIKKYAIEIGLSSTLLISFLFSLLIAQGVIIPLEYSGDVVCAGTPEDPCEATMTFNVTQDFFIYKTNYDPWGRDTPIELEPGVKEWHLYRSWGTSWREIDLEKGCTGSWCGCSYCSAEEPAEYAYAFRAGKQYTLKLEVLKNSPYEDVKWSFTNEIDPIFKNVIDREVKDRETVEQLRNTNCIETKEGIKKEYTFENRGLKLTNTSTNKTIIDLELSSSYNLMLPAGEDVRIAEIYLNEKDNNIEKLFDSVYFYNIKEGYLREEKDITFKYTDEVINYTCEFDTKDFKLENALQEEFCENYTVPNWGAAKEFTDLSELPSKDVYIGIYTNTKLGEEIEWVPVIKGFANYVWASYEITEIASLEHDTTNNVYNSLTQIDSTHYILAYAGTDFDGYITTFSIDGSYEITEIDSLEHDTVFGLDNSLTQIDSTHYILAYMGPDLDGYITTFSIDGSYEITEIDSLEHDTTNGMYNSLTQIDTTHYILAYAGTGYEGYITTFSIDGSYEITEIASLYHDTNNGRANSLVQIDSTHYILAYYGLDDDGYIKTFSIDGNYNITELDEVEHDTVYGRYNSLTQIDTTHYILAYAGPDDDGYIKTFSIDAPAGDTCTCPGSGSNWEINMSDDCNLTENCDLTTGNITFIDTGNFYVNATLDVTTFGDISANQIIWILSGGIINIE